MKSVVLLPIFRIDVYFIGIGTIIIIDNIIIIHYYFIIIQFYIISFLFYLFMTSTLHRGNNCNMISKTLEIGGNFARVCYGRFCSVSSVVGFIERNRYSSRFKSVVSISHLSTATF